MKKILSIFTLCLLIANLSPAQEKTTTYLPEEGDWAIGVDALPILRYAGNIFNGNTDNKYIDNISGRPFVNTNKRFTDRGLVPDVSIMGKYMLTDEWGLRGNIGFMFRSIHDNRYVRDDRALALNPLSEDKVIDYAHYKRNGASIMLGAEYRKGQRRVQGVFGMGVLFAFQNDNTSYTYGNELTDINQRPSTSFSEVYDDNGYRVIKTNGKGSDFYTGLTGSAGFEWFVAPKISLGAEVNLSLYYILGNQDFEESEGYNTSSGKIEKKTDLISPRYNEFYFGTENLGGSLYMTFYF